MRSERTFGWIFATASVVPALAGLVASTMLAVDYLRPMPVFCQEGSGCDALRHTSYAGLFGVPTPLFGVVGFLAIGIVALIGGRRARLAQLALALGAALVGVLLVLIQARIGQLCPYCMVADTSAMLSAVIASARLAWTADAPTPRPLVLAGAGLLVIAVVFPATAGMRMKVTVPAVIREEMAHTPKGEVTIVDFVDFECPYCRMTHAELEEAVQAESGRVHRVRRQVPLSSIHPHALDAARAACCAELLGKGDVMANALFTAPPDELTREGCERIAERVGLSLDPYRACVVDPKTDAQIQSDRAEFKAAGGYALPTIWVDENELVGSQPAGVLQSTIDAALARAGS
jgi:uncharacterized membrane protein/predicted DsbA family dithiol-disulfide isomerase